MDLLVLLHDLADDLIGQVVTQAHFQGTDSVVPGHTSARARAVVDLSKPERVIAESSEKRFIR